MSQVKSSQEPVHFSPATLDWLVAATEPKELDPENCTLAKLVYNEALRNIQKKILDKDAQSHATRRNRA